jgi:hypothetical protein
LVQVVRGGSIQRRLPIGVSLMRVVVPTFLIAYFLIHALATQATVLAYHGGMALKFTTSYLEDSLSVFRYYKRLAEAAMQQVTDEQLFVVLDPEMNSIALIVKHMAGNMRSRWTDFLTSDGEKADRNRDSEFVEPPSNREGLMSLWESGWSCAFSALEPVSQEDMSRTVFIRGEAHSVMQAISRQIAHYAYHCGQIVFLAKHFQHAQWRSPTVPRGQSAKFDQQVKAGEASQR